MSQPAEIAASLSSAERPMLSVVAPCYNEEAVLPEFYRRLSAVCRQVTDRHEIVLVDDGSRDRTWAMMSDLAKQDPHVVAVKLSRNHGHQLALTAGLTVCRGQRILIIDADLQDAPEHLPAMLALMDQGADVVYGQRRQRAGESVFKLWTAEAFYRVLNRLSDTPIPGNTGDFRLMSRAALDVFLTMPERHRFIRGMVSWLGFRQVPYLFDRDSRFAGETKYPFWKMFRLALDALVAFSWWPLRVPGYLAAGTGAVGLLLWAGALVGWIGGWGAAIWLLVLGAMAVLASLQLAVLSILGQYVGRTYDHSKGRPLFIIEKIERAGDKSGE